MEDLIFGTKKSKTEEVNPEEKNAELFNILINEESTEVNPQGDDIFDILNISQEATPQIGEEQKGILERENRDLKTGRLRDLQKIQELEKRLMTIGTDIKKKEAIEKQEYTKRLDSEIKNIQKDITEKSRKTEETKIRNLEISLRNESNQKLATIQKQYEDLVKTKIKEMIQNTNLNKGNN